MTTLVKRQYLFGRAWFLALTLLVIAAPLAHAQTMPDPDAIKPISLAPPKELSSPHRISSFSGLPVPRYASLKYGEVNGRQGPSLQYPVRWRYERQGLPVLVVRESAEWRMIKDPQGDKVWVHERMLGARRTGITAEATHIYANPTNSEPAIAQLGVGVVADVAECEGGWCRVTVGGRQGWTPRMSIWGVDDLG